MGLGRIVGKLLLLNDVVEKAMRGSGESVAHLRSLESTLHSLQQIVVQQIGEHNVELGLPKEEIESLGLKLEDGIKLVAKFSKTPGWICWLCFVDYSEEIDDLDRALKGLLTKLKMQEARDLKEVLVLSRQNRDMLDEVEGILWDTLQRTAGDAAQHLISGCHTQTVPNQAQGNGVEQADGGEGSFNQIAKATRSFSQSQQVGEGRSGTVYKAQLDDGQEVSINRAKKEHFENLQTEFSSEVEPLTKCDHLNPLVRIIGYARGVNECLFITDNVACREHPDGQFGKILDFKKRLKIACGVAHALANSAENLIIHGNVEPSNILLTESMRAKVARPGPMDTDQTHISTKAKGTAGYLDPEYVETGQLTPKSDVYSFGILLIEILTGRRPVELKRPVGERVTLRWAFKKFNEGKVMELVDPSMKEEVEAALLAKIFDLAMKCTAPLGADRPDMNSVMVQLQNMREDYLRGQERVVSIL